MFTQREQVSFTKIQFLTIFFVKGYQRHIQIYFHWKRRTIWILLFKKIHSFKGIPRNINLDRDIYQSFLFTITNGDGK
jgi:hypothetical protein